MVKFDKFVKKKKSVDVKDLGLLFESLDRQSTHVELRPIQLKAILEINARREEKDLVLKINTGRGKTTLGLLYLQSHMEEKKEPVVYLCPTIQLIQQVCEEAKKLGISANPYPGKEPHPHPDGLSAKSIIVCTYTNCSMLNQHSIALTLNYVLAPLS